ncbi:hypothetical protein PMZ80_005388 [Knufia obscura]|uniref:VOC domain-containing protein n=2 Tax=Knufia TaxID=430999 RepID=A0AAN8ISC9_9EURO|nr:hypothetical protein PMZ80_005388 [Knufia obscura]KAK5958057.1 hypothetical protein OHC33_001247 [Knufia fluminis]
MSSTNSSANSISDQASQASENEPLISGLHHVNIQVPPQTLHIASQFYAGTLGLTQTPAPDSMKAHLAWFDMGSSGQQIHITSQFHLDQAQMKAQSESPRHLCFKILSEDKLDQLQERIWQLYKTGGESAPVHCDDPAQTASGRIGPKGFPKRFFARDYAGNRLEFSL